MPRSPSRDLSDRYIGNRRYFRQPDGIRRAKNWLSLTVLSLTAGWAVVDAASLNRKVVESSHTHGTLADVHTPFDANCEACHVKESLGSLSPKTVLHAQDRWLTLTCEKCHAGPAHHGKVIVDANGKSFNDQCSNCHHDHRGRDNSLTKIADSHCTHCHANLPANDAEGKYTAYPSAEKITGFSEAGGHPEFRELAEHPPEKGTPYPRGLKFSHGLHMTAGMAYPKGGPLWRLKDFKTTDDRHRYLAPGQKDEDDSLVQLRCESCHLMDSGFAKTGQPGGEAFARWLKPLADQPKNSILPPRAEGAYYLPVNFDAHCKSCHPLAAPETKSGDSLIASFPLPHRKQPADLKKTLQGEFAARIAQPDNPKVPSQVGPGARLDPRAPASLGGFLDEVNRLTATTLNTLLLGAAKAGQDPAAPTADGYRVSLSGYACGKCHYTDDPTAKPEAQKIAAIPNKTVWFGHAMFIHDAHRSTTCAECHPGTYGYAAGQTAVNEREPIQITGIASCRQCHSPARTETVNGQPMSVGGIAHGCTDCHRYHNGDHPLQGRGAISRDPAARLTVSEFLRGGR